MGISVTYVTVWALSDALDKSTSSGGHLEGAMSKILNSQSPIEHSVPRMLYCRYTYKSVHSKNWKQAKYPARWQWVNEMYLHNKLLHSY